MALTRRELLRVVGFMAWGIVGLMLAPDASARTKDGPAEPHVEVTWVGGPTLVITFGDLTILTDPTLGESFAMGDPNDAVDHETVRSHHRLTPVAGVDLRRVDLLLLSHIHEDHFDQQAASTLDRGLAVLAPTADVAALRTKGFRMVDGLTWGETRTFDSSAGRVRITAMPARHSRAPAIAKALGTGNGYWLEFSKGAWKRTLYWTGDTLPTPDVVEAVSARGSPDVLVPHVGGVGPTGPFGQISMRAADVVTLADAIRPRYVLPIHHSTYAFYREPIHELSKASEGKPFRLDLVAAGPTLRY
ncbi:MBL fold metallo-hydrolase [Vitiosangium sp. GDMCC 1.1324]|uniref:MBL fold metallo-hydrolase n=1 Tax=Vitiosangium sp. (strain GDMCC 1.1324) TaxID=2138576 RepID=UPI000D3799C8|nr:MBL fold metallo-hydrolase [Vitiosangium sp. GDMCC 1.1324]PTL83000.1 hypothetical protein DAT35_13335 [Vitiosangium sp. GDMCC 1.1324]